MTTAELIEEIEAARETARTHADAADAKVREAAVVAAELLRELSESEEKLREAVKTLRRAGLLK